MRRVTTLLLVLALLALPLGPHAAGAGGAPGWQRGVSDLIGGGPLWGTLGPDGRIYVFGLQLEAYDLHRRAWTLITAKPTAHSGTALVAAGTRVYALCGDANPPGLNTPDLRALNVAAAYAPATNRWAPIAPSLDPHLECAAARGQDGRLYVFGGGDEASFTSITPEVYDPRANTWTYITPPVNPLRRGKPLLLMEAAAVTAPDGRVYVLGGSAYDESSRSWAALRAVEVYTPATNRWASAPPMPVRRTAFAAVLGSDGRIYVIGGTSTPYYTASPARALRTVDSYCPRTRTWSRTSRLPVASLGLAAAMGPDGRIYAIGGSAGNAVYTYRVPPGPC